MSNLVKSVLDKAIYKKEKYNILTFDTHERYQTQLCKTGHDFYSFRYENCKQWNEEYAALPTNYYIMPSNSIVTGISFDFILSQSKFGQFQVAHQIAQQFGLPILSLEHTLPINSWPDQQLQNFKNMIGDVNVFISEYSAREWGMECDQQVVHHSVDSQLFKPGNTRHNHVLSVVNDFVNRDYCCNYQGWKRVTDGLNVKLVGDTQGLSKPAENIDDLVNEYQTSKIFLNTSTVSPVPTALLEAMSCGCAVVSTATCMIPEIIENGANGFISNDEGELRGYIDKLLEDDELAKKLGEAARKTVIEKFSEESFINNWNKVFDKTYGIKK